MAKARDIPGIAGTMPFREAARRAVAIRAQEVFDHSEGVLDLEDIERVHAMRVATRRLRAVLEVFAGAFDKGEHRAVLKDVKALADALGDRRDPDVQLLGIARLKEQLPEPDHPGLEVFAHRLRVEQAQANQALAVALETMQRDDLEGRLSALVAS
jgi:CHAD domain-containing protein